MGYILFYKQELGTPHRLKWYATHKGAKIGLKAANRNAGRESYAILEENEFEDRYSRSTRSMITTTGKVVDSRPHAIATPESNCS
jgi:hypothetical protein